MATRYAGDPARERRAEERARELLRSIAGERALEMYERLGFLSVEHEGGEYGYLIYPQRPIVAYDAAAGELLSEYCVRFLDGSDPEAGERLPDADDVLAKWMALRVDEDARWHRQRASARPPARPGDGPPRSWSR